MKRFFLHFGLFVFSGFLLSAPASALHEYELTHHWQVKGVIVDINPRENLLVVKSSLSSNKRKYINLVSDTNFAIFEPTRFIPASLGHFRIGEKIIMLGKKIRRKKSEYNARFITKLYGRLPPSAQQFYYQTPPAYYSPVYVPPPPVPSGSGSLTYVPPPPVYVPAGYSPVVPPPAPAPAPTPSPTPVPPSFQVPSSPNCATPLPQPTGRTVTVGTFNELRDALEDANNTGGNVTILLRDGIYEFNGFLRASRKTSTNITIRSLSGNRDGVILRGQGMSGYTSHIFWVSGDYTTIADVSIGSVANHPIQVFGENDPDNLLIHNVRIFDAGEQLFKVSVDNARRGERPENGIIECSLFEYTTPRGPQWYMGGIDAHNSVNWIVRDNFFRNIRSPTSEPTEHAIHFWGGSEGTIIERNIIINSDRGIGFGLGSGSETGHTGGIIRNNFIYHAALSDAGDVGIGLEGAPGARVYNNTIFFEHAYANAIEYRFGSTTGVEIANNLTNKRIQQRDNGQAVLENNVTNADRSWFRNPTTGDLHLTSDISTVVNQGKNLSSFVTNDIDGQARPFSGAYDIGADER